MENLPFTWNIRVSKRATRPRITISAYGKVELVCPIRCSRKAAVTMLIDHQAWVVKQLEKLDYTVKEVLVLPRYIQLLAVGITWEVQYIQQSSSKVKITEDGAQLYVYADLSNPEAIRKDLCVWLKEKGKLYLSPWLEETAKMMGLSFHDVTIRLQKKRWGSCSRARRINLNAALLFLPADLVEHVLIHELAHLKYLNHSPLFWTEVEKFDKECGIKRKQLRHQSGSVPAWVSESFVIRNT